MSLRDEKILSLLGTNIDKLSDEELKKLCKKILKSKIHGICFSLYEGDQQPGDIVSDDQIIRRLKILKPYTSSIRTFSSLGEHSRIVEIAKDMGFKTLVGAWLSDDFESNDKEIEGLIQLANKGLVDVAAVGNEVIYRKELSEEQLISYINDVKENIKNIPFKDWITNNKTEWLTKEGEEDIYEYLDNCKLRFQDYKVIQNSLSCFFITITI